MVQPVNPRLQFEIRGSQKVDADVGGLLELGQMCTVGHGQRSYVMMNFIRM